MNLNEEDFKEWRHRADERLAALTSGETIQNDRLDELDEGVAELHETLTGNHAKGYDGLIREIETVEHKVAMLLTIMSPDALGHGGVSNRLKSLEEWRKNIEKWSDNKWKFWTAVAIGVISTSGLVLTNLSNIVDAVKKVHAPPPVVTKAKKVQRAKKMNLMTYTKCDPRTDPYYSEEECSQNEK